nr:unnamed protein product [Digitaria exilis]
MIFGSLIVEHTTGTAHGRMIQAVLSLSTSQQDGTGTGQRPFPALTDHVPITIQATSHVVPDPRSGTASRGTRNTGSFRVPGN